MMWRSRCSCFCRAMWLSVRLAILHVLLPARRPARSSSAPRPFGFQRWTGEDQRIAARIVVEHRLDRRVGKDAAVPVEFAVDAHRRKGRRQRARRHDVFDARAACRGCRNSASRRSRHWRRRRSAAARRCSADRSRSGRPASRAAARSNNSRPARARAARAHSGRRADWARRTPSTPDGDRRRDSRRRRPPPGALESGQPDSPVLDPAPEVLQPARRCSGGLPAISAALIAPIEVPITQSGSMPASCSAW